MLKLLLIPAISVACYFALAFALFMSQHPRDRVASGETLDFARILVADEQPAPVGSFIARDGTRLNFSRFEGGGADIPLLILVHGSGWYGQSYLSLARKLAATRAADVIVPDLRGHGPEPIRRGDVDYIGQLEDDLADLILAERKEGQEIVLAGHSSGGGLVIRFAGGRHGPMIGRAVLLAPFIQHDAPTSREKSGGWAHPLIRRIIGLTMLNKVGITALNGLPVIQFAMPESVLAGPLGAAATTQYSFRLNQSFAPRRDYLGDIAALPPFLLVAGRDDEAFRAGEYEPLMSRANAKGEYLILDGVAHLDVFDPDNSAEPIIDFLKADTLAPQAKLD